MIDNIILSGAQKSVLTSTQRIGRSVDKIQQALASGKDVHTALDNPQSFFAAKELSFRASDLNKLLDGIGQSVRTLQETDHGVAAIIDLLDLAEANAQESLTAGFSSSLGEGETVLGDSSQGLTFARGDDTIRIPGLPLDGTSGSQATVEFWMEWDGTDNVMPFSFFAYDLWFRGGNFGFNTFTNDIYGISSAGLANTPVHVAAVFTDSDVASNQLYINGVEQSISQVRGSFTNARAQLIPNAQISGTDRSPNVYGFSGEIDEVRIWDGALTAEDIQSNINLSIAGPQDNLLASYTFDNISDGAGGIIDETGNGHDATLSGMTVAGNAISFDFPDLGFPIQNLPSANNTLYSEQHAEILNQIDKIVEDANYRGINLLNTENLVVSFNEDRTNTLTIEGIDASALGLGLTEASFTSRTELLSTLGDIKTARDTMRSFSRSVQNDLGIIQTRQDFTKRSINILESGADDLTLADMNEKGAELLATQARQSLSAVALSLASESSRSVLSLF
ncbi:MAG: hypothetical protein DHS20C02_19550 [Micavibrio sp.]|nr:MAG: hypothetical protein DHS20C02_19550 [Micavibrio sp.]